MYVVKTEIKESKIEGKGYFASEFIPQGTFVYFYSKDDIKYSHNELLELDGFKKRELTDFAVEDEYGNWVLTKSGPFTNHSCDPNILPIFLRGSYFDIAIKDINIGDEITIDYSLFFSSAVWSMECKCHSSKCRHMVGFGQRIDSKVEENWFSKIQESLQKSKNLKQPLFENGDKNAQSIKESYGNINQPTIAKYIKYSIIESNY